jgi:hypothetical protein
MSYFKKKKSQSVNKTALRFKEQNPTLLYVTTIDNIDHQSDVHTTHDTRQTNSATSRFLLLVLDGRPGGGALCI